MDIDNMHDSFYDVAPLLNYSPAFDATYGMADEQSTSDVATIEMDEQNQLDKQYQSHLSSSSTVGIPQQISAAQARTKTTCPIPGCARTVLKRVLARHLRTVHGQGRTYICERCEIVFHRKDSLERHESEQHGDEAGNVRCTRCGAKVVPRAMKEHRRSRRCRERVVTREIRDVTGSIPRNFSVKDAFHALLAGASYLVQIRGHGLPIRPLDTTLLEARQRALGSLRGASGTGTLDITMLCAVWIFGLADMIYDGSPDAHRGILSRADRDVQERSAQFQEVLGTAFRQVNGSQSTRPLVTHISLHGYGMDPVEWISRMSGSAPGCRFITNLAGFEAIDEGHAGAHTIRTHDRANICNVAGNHLRRRSRLRDARCGIPGIATPRPTTAKSSQIDSGPRAFDPDMNLVRERGPWQCTKLSKYRIPPYYMSTAIGRISRDDEAALDLEWRHPEPGLPESHLERN